MSRRFVSEAVIVEEISLDHVISDDISAVQDAVFRYNSHYSFTLIMFFSYNTILPLGTAKKSSFKRKCRFPADEVNEKLAFGNSLCYVA